MQSNIKYKGISRTPSDATTFQGEMEECYNLVSTFGELKPIVPPDVIGSITGDIVHIHKTASYTHFLVNTPYGIKYYTLVGQTLTFIDKVVVNLGSAGLVKVSSMGNMVIVLTNSDIRYSLWKDGLYKPLSSNIPYPRLSFSLQSGTYEGQSHKATITDDRFDDDFKKVRDTMGRSPFTTDIAGGRVGRASAEQRTSGGLPDSTEKLVSPEFDNYMKGHINTRIEALTEKGFYVFPFFIRYAIRLFDGSLIKHSPPFLMLPTQFLPFQAGIDIDKESKVTYVYFQNISKLRLFNASINLTDYEDVVEGIDIFMSDPVYTYDYAGSITGHKDNPLTDGRSTPELLLGGIYKTKEDILSEISAVSDFRKVGSVSIQELQTAGTRDFKVENLKALLQQEPMSDDFQTHDTIKADNAFIYNDRLHLSGVERTRFEGFRYGVRTVFLPNNDTSIDVGPQPFIYYPGKATSAMLEKSRNRSGIEYSTQFLPLTDHSGLNGSFYLNPDLEDIPFPENSYIPSRFGGTLNPPSRVVNENNKLYVSKSQNPLYFPVESRVTLPVGKIMGVASNTQAISSGQFGQFPLYVFTSDGIWVMEVDTVGKYMVRQPVSREVCINQNIVPMDNHIAFITKKGLAIISGSETETITDIIADNNNRISKIDISSALSASGASSLNTIYNTVNIEEYMKQAQIGYEYIRGMGRIFLFNPTYEYSYVFDLLSKSWTKTFTPYKRIVNNYPDCYVHQKNNMVANLSSIGASAAPVKVMFLTRPITMNASLFNIGALIHRGMFASALRTVIYASRDGINYVPISSSKKNHLRSIGTPFRSYKYLVVADLKPNETLTGADIELSPRYGNRLR